MKEILLVHKNIIIIKMDLVEYLRGWNHERCCKDKK